MLAKGELESVNVSGAMSMLILNAVEVFFCSNSTVQFSTIMKTLQDRDGRISKQTNTTRHSTMNA